LGGGPGYGRIIARSVRRSFQLDWFCNTDDIRHDLAYYPVSTSA